MLPSIDRRRPAGKPRLRRTQVGIAVSPDGRFVYTANSRSGSVSVIDAAKRTVVREIEVAGRISGFALSADGKLLLTCDAQKHQLVLLSGGPTAWKIAGRIPVAAYPFDLVVTRDGRRCYVSSLWSRSVTVVDLLPAGKAKPRVAATIRLPFLPGKLCLARGDSRLIVAGMFAGKLGIVDTRRNSLSAVKEIPGHNIRGLAVSGDGNRLITAQQSLNSLAHSTREDVHWGNMMVNVVYSLAVDDVCDAKANPLRDLRETHLGGPENGAGDPAAIAVAKERIAIALAGVNEVAISRGLTDPLSRIAVGRRPSAVAITPDGKTVFVADAFSDSVSVVDAERAKRVAVVSLGPRPKLSAAVRGERLFFDARLSHDGWLSCHSCHSNGHTNGLLNDNLSDGSFGAPKRVLSLLGVGKTGPWAWNGGVAKLEQQVKNSVTKTMRGKPPSDRDVADLVAYLKTLQPPPPPARFDAKPNAAAIAAGRALFTKFDCLRCHAPPTYTSKGTYDVGLKDSVGQFAIQSPVAARRRLADFAVPRRPGAFAARRLRKTPAPASPCAVEVGTRAAHRVPAISVNIVARCDDPTNCNHVFRRVDWERRSHDAKRHAVSARFASSRRELSGERFAMHIPDGILGPQVCVATGAVALGAVGIQSVSAEGPVGRTHDSDDRNDGRAGLRRADGEFSDRRVRRAGRVGASAGGSAGRGGAGAVGGLPGDHAGARRAMPVVRRRRYSWRWGRTC